MSDQEQTKSRVADSMDAAVAMLAREQDAARRLTDEQLRQAKVTGCTAFRGSRVYVDELLEWWDENGDSVPTGNAAIDAIQTEIAREKLRKIRFANDVEERKYIKREDEAAKLLALGLEIKSTLRKRLEEEFPDRAEKRAADELRPICRQLVDELCRIFQEGTSKWSH